MGLGKAIQQELDWLRRTGRYKLSIKNQILGMCTLSPKKDLVILRLLQEIINNIIKHAKAHHIEINIFIANDILFLKIKENGIGFNFEEMNEQKKGLGLHSIHKRVEMMTGVIKIDSKFTYGTTITVEIPYP
jgi:signal transduction histidine kinase